MLQFTYLEENLMLNPCKLNKNFFNIIFFMEYSPTMLGNARIAQSLIETVTYI